MTVARLFFHSCACLVAITIAGPANAHAQSAILHRFPPPVSSPTLSTHPATQPWLVETDDQAHVGLWGFVSGALIGGAAGYAFGSGICDGVPRGNCARNSTIGGVVIGGLVGYGLERLFRWR